jgi:HNH endonuclease
MTKDHKPYKKKATENRFWSHVDKCGPIPAHRPEIGNCWVWTAALCGPGYGTFKIGTLGIDRRNAMAHRFSYELHCGPIPDGKSVLHHCDNKTCVRPTHFFTGTQADNMDDKVAKSRQPVGVSVYNAKLDDQKINAARLYRLNGWSYKNIGDRFNVGPMTVHDALSGKKWKHVGGVSSAQS